MRKPERIIATVLDMYFEGLSVRKVARQIAKIFGVEVDYSTIWDWIQKYSRLVKNYVDSLKVDVGKEWQVDETVINSKGSVDPWFWEVLDKETRFMVASHLSKSRTEEDAIELFRKAKEKAKHTPKRISTDGLQAYRKGYKKNFWVRYKDERPELIQKVRLRGEINNNSVERLHGTLKDRTKPARGLGSNRIGGNHRIDTIDNLLKSWEIHYNFVRPQTSLKGKIPEEVAGIEELNDWRTLIKQAIKHIALATN